MQKLSKKSETFAMGAMKLLLPSSQISPGLASLRGIMKRQAPMDPSALDSVQAVPMANQMLPNMFPSPAYQSAQLAYPMQGYQNPYLGNPYFPQFDASKRTFPSYMPAPLPVPYQGSFSQPMAMPSQPVAMAVPSQPMVVPNQPEAMAMPGQPAAASALAVPPMQAESIQPEISDTKKDKITTDMDVVEKNADGFDTAVKNYKEASIIRQGNDVAELTEKVNDDAVDKAAEKRDKAGKKEHFTNFFTAYKKTMDNRNTLESKLVNYFTNYVCGDDC